MTVDEILATGKYTDRWGWVWAKHTYYHGTVEWFHPLGNGACYINTVAEMRLLIERDLHRDECRGIFDCDVHPVPTVFTELGWFYAVAAGEGTITGERHDTHAAAMDSARALAVSE